MQLNMLLAGLLGTALVVGVYVTTPAFADAPTTARSNFSAPRNHSHLMGVRAEYVAKDAIHGQTDTEVVIVNTHGTQSLKILGVYVLGRDGVNKVLLNYRGLNGKTIPPLGQVVLQIDSSIGVTAGSHTRPASTDVASVIVGWEGRSNVLKLTAVVQQWEISRSIDGFRGISIEEGYEVLF